MKEIERACLEKKKKKNIYIYIYRERERERESFDVVVEIIKKE